MVARQSVPYRGDSGLCLLVDMRKPDADGPLKYSMNVLPVSGWPMWFCRLAARFTVTGSFVGFVR